MSSTPIPNSHFENVFEIPPHITSQTCCDFSKVTQNNILPPNKNNCASSCLFSCPVPSVYPQPAVMMATPNRRRSALQELPVVLSPLSVSLLEDSILNDSNLSSFASPAPSPDEYIIRQRGRRSISVTWSPPKNNTTNNNSLKMTNLNTSSSLSHSRSPMKTPTKNNNNPQLQMVLRSSPRKRLLMASEGLRPSLNGSGMASLEEKPTEVSPNQKLLESTKRLRIAEKSCAQQDTKVPLSVYLRGYSQDQLIDLIVNQLVLTNPQLEKKLKEELPVPDIR